MKILYTVRAEEAPPQHERYRDKPYELMAKEEATDDISYPDTSLFYNNKLNIK